ncbi:MAG: ABC transporter substrate-binding protein [Alphaproteobacteria bacterium]|jgi:NitT/TauT family transport system substrate-binding protein|nr:ABC transporter substrate-binding protein [Alphaproteobacteria bacterium]
MRAPIKALTLVLAAALAGPALSPDARAQERDSFRIAWSIYVGWMPWGYAADAGIIDRWADRYGIDIEVVQINDYIESINQYTAGAFDGCVMTNMDALTIPAAGGVDSTALIVGDFSDGNDGLVVKGDRSLEEMAGSTIHLVELSVSHYLLARALESVGLSERDVTLVNTSDADIVSVYTASPDVEAVVTWNPLLMEVAAMPDSTRLFDSSQIPGEIIDMMVVNTEVLEANPDFGRALVGAWYETMALMAAGDEEALTAMATAAGTDLAGYQAQLDSTQMFYEPAEAVAFTESPDLITTMDLVRQFSFTHGLLGPGAASPDVVGIAFPGGEVLGDPNNVNLRFTPDFMRLAAEDQL